jgi:DNA glycosylase AlkZ-like
VATERPSIAAGPRASARLRRRLVAQGLAGPPLGSGAHGPVAVARRLLATQGQDPRGFRLAVRARTRGTSGADVDRALGEERTLLVTWLNRGTLHLVTREDYPLLQALVAPWQRTSAMTRLAQLGIDEALADRSVALVDRWLAEDGPLSRAALRERLLAAGVPAEGQSLVHVLFRASLDGVLVRGPLAPPGGGVEQLYVRVADWMPEAPPAVDAVRRDPERGYAEIARRYLVGHGPADPRDLAKWLAAPLGCVRAALHALGSRVVASGDGSVELAAASDGTDHPETARAAATGRATPRGAGGTVPLPPPRLLGAFEPLLLGWRSREDVLGDHGAAVISGGVFRGIGLAGGRAVGAWRFARGGVDFTPFAALSESVERALERDAAAVLRFLGR